MLQVGLSLGRSEEDIRPLIKRVVDECWYDSIDSLRSLNEASWSELGLPPRFKQALQARLEEVHLPISSSSTSSDSQTASSDLVSACQALAAHPEEAALAARILSNLITGEARFRRLNGSSIAMQKALALPVFSETLKVLGFQSEGVHLAIGSSVFSKAQLQEGILRLKSHFDPFKPSFSSTAGSMPVPRSAADERSREIANLRNQNQVVQRGGGTVQVFKPSQGPIRQTLGGVSVARPLQEGMHAPPSSESDSEGDRELLESVIRGLGKERTFESRQKRELLRKKNSYCSIRVLLPDGFVIQFDRFFDENHKVQILIDKLNELLDNFDWFLTCATKKISPTSSFEQQGLSPSATLRLVFSNKQPSLKESVAANAI